MNTTLNSLELSWNSPSNLSFDHFELNYIEIDAKVNHSIRLDKTTTGCVLNITNPGTSILINIITILDDLSVANVTYTDINRNRNRFKRMVL